MRFLNPSRQQSLELTTMHVPAKCNQCKQVFRTLPDCEAHAASMGHQPHPAYFCELCPELFTTQKQRSAHMQGPSHAPIPLPQTIIHAHPPVIQVQGLNDRRYLCNTCLVLLSSDAARLDHMRLTSHFDFARLTPMNTPQADDRLQMQQPSWLFAAAAAASSSSRNETPAAPHVTAAAPTRVSLQCRPARDPVAHIVSRTIPLPFISFHLSVRGQTLVQAFVN